MRRLRVASYNTRDFLDDHDLAARVVQAIDPDVLCLQEVPRRLLSGVRVARFARACSMSWPGGHRGSGGTTILVSERVRAERVHHHRLPVRWPDRTRGYAVAELATQDERRVVVVSVHLGLRPEERLSHVERILEGVVRDGRCLVVAGDLNEDENGPAFAALLAGGSLRPVSPRGPTYPARSPRRRLDVVLASPDLRVLPHREVLVPAAALAAASDHLPTWVDLAVG